VTWTTRKSGTINSLDAVTWGGNLFVAVGSDGTIIVSPPSGNVPRPPGSLGDLNGDVNVTVLDVVLAMRLVLGLEVLTDQQKLNVDVNQDGVVNISDVVIIMRYALGVVTTFDR
jgi:hypothetical protein